MLTVIFGGQFGSEGKGLAASYVARKNYIKLSTTDAGPNAGHTAMWDGTKVVTFHLPMVGVLTPGSIIYLNGGAVIDPDILEKEIQALENQAFQVRDRLKIHPCAAVITADCIAAEKDVAGAMQKISSTQKGVGAAVASKVLRVGVTAKDVKSLKKYIASYTFDAAIDTCVEVAQGYSLGCNTQFYPYTTSRVCTPAQGLMNAGIPTNMTMQIMAVIRTNPIRVGSLPGSSSGGCYTDQEETTWKKLRLEPQYTTVTKRLRRVFTYSKIQVANMIIATRPTTILINFCNHASTEEVRKIEKHIRSVYEDLWLLPPKILYGMGPAPEDVYDQIR